MTEFLQQLVQHFLQMDLLTSELQPSKLKGNKAVTNFYEVHQRVQVVRSQNETVPGAEVSPAAQEEVSTKAVLQGAGQVLIEDGVQIVVVRAWGQMKEGVKYINKSHVTALLCNQCDH